MVSCRVAIVGGGPAGCATAIALARAGIDDVVVVDAGTCDRPRVGESLPPDIRLLFRQLGLWDAFVAQDHARCLGSCSAWGDDQLGYNDFVLNPFGPGWHLDRRRFDRWLADSAADAGVAWRADTRLTGAVTAGRGHTLQLLTRTGSEQVHARFVIDATGGSARFARLQGARRESIDQLFFVYGFFRRPPGAAEHGLTLVESTVDGWWYRASLPEARLCVAFACERSTLRERQLMRWQSWLDALAETRHAARGLEGHVFLHDEMLVMPVTSGRILPAVGAGWLAVGDAASSFDPLLASGIHKAMEDGIAAAAVVVRWLRAGEDAADDYAAALAARYAIFVQMRGYFYARETRWPRSPFWQARTPVPTAA
ncbi:MAG: tryptophan 7-halogenase [Rhodanobacter sp.]